MTRLLAPFVAAALATPLLLGPTGVAWATETKVLTTKPQKFGDGWARVYVALDAQGHPLALGVSLGKEVLEGLPKEPDLTSRCFDKNGNGRMDADECLGDYNLTFELPDGAAGAVAPFKWVMLNWNPHGHSPPAPPPWAVPHFDFHFYIAPREAVKALRTGACGEMIDCGDFRKATRPVPARLVHRDHVDVGAAVPDMGNHLIDSKSPDLQPNGPPFSHTFIYGAYDGRITFLEPMITHAYIASKPSMCAPIKQPQEWELAGSYPTRYCVRYLDRPGRYTISVEDFVQRPGW
jgi:hypothetical protein